MFSGDTHWLFRFLISRASRPNIPLERFTRFVSKHKQNPSQEEKKMHTCQWNCLLLFSSIVRIDVNSFSRSICFPWPPPYTGDMRHSSGHCSPDPNMHTKKKKFNCTITKSIFLEFFQNEYFIDACVRIFLMGVIFFKNVHVNSWYTFAASKFFHILWIRLLCIVYYILIKDIANSD